MKRRGTFIAAGLALGFLAAGLVALPAQATTAHTPATVVSKVTGPGSLSSTDTQWKVKATDLGILWDNGSGQTLAAFGDTFGTNWTGPGAGTPAGVDGDWRSQVLLRSSDTNLADGMTFDSAATDVPGHAKQLISAKHIDNDEITVIPTAGIAVGSRQYLSYMSVRHWGLPGEWTTNYASIAYSDDNGQTWVKDAGPRWDNANGTGNNQFQMQAFVHKDGYVYVYGTPSGRSGSLHLARVPENQVLSATAYQYWTGSAWLTGAESSAASVVSAPVSEISVAYNSYTGKYLMMYINGEDLVLRSSTTPQGPWSAPNTIVGPSDYPGFYGGFIHPQSSGNQLYFVMSQWNPYNTYLMKISLNTDATVAKPNLLNDPSFERNTALGGDWKCAGTCGIDNQHWGFSGDKNAWARHNSGWQDVHQSVAVTPNTQYTLSGFVRTSASSYAGFMGARTSSWQVISETTFSSVPGWTRYTVSFNSGANSSITVYGGIWTDHGDAWLQLDDFSLTQT